MTEYNRARAGLFDATREHPITDQILAVAPSRSIDWCTLGAMTPVRDQRPCASCTSFGLMAVLESYHKRKTGREIELDAAWVHAWISKRQCKQAQYLANLAFALSAREKIPTVQDTAARPNDPSLIGSFSLPKLVDLQGIAAIKDHLAKFGPVAATLSVSPEFFQHWPNNDVYRPAAKFSDHHVICLTGFDEDQKFWRAKNSFGPAWSDDGGYVRIAYDSCEIGTYKFSTYGAAA